MRFDQYDAGGFYDEWMTPDGKPRPEAALLVRMMESLPEGELTRRQLAAERALLLMGITFAVYGHRAGAEKVWPFDVLPRLINMEEWERVERGLKQRIQALNIFINDIYHDQRIVRDRVIPEEIIRSAKSFRPECIGLNPPAGIWCHITGTDLVRDRDGRLYVLEDNLRCPSGVSYVLENRAVMKRTFPQVFQASHVLPVDDYPSRLLEMLQFVAPFSNGTPRVAVLTPGVHNSAYFEHAFLARQMGVELVEGRDLRVDDGRVYMKTTRGLERVDVLYRRIDDDFLDPTTFRRDSALGVPGLMKAYRSGKVSIINAPGTGIADDKVVYAFVPKMIKYYLGEEPLLPSVPTYLCSDPKEQAFVLEHLDELVVKSANESGGYGMLVGPHSTQEQRAEFSQKIKSMPRNFIAQPTLALSRVPTLVEGKFEGRHVDLRPYILFGREIYVLPGGLTRVALQRGSLVVNSSQGGGSKDTWVLPPLPAPEKIEIPSAAAAAAGAEA